MLRDPRSLSIIYTILYGKDGSLFYVWNMLKYKTFRCLYRNKASDQEVTISDQLPLAEFSGDQN